MGNGEECLGEADRRGAAEVAATLATVRVGVFEVQADRVQVTMAAQPSGHFGR
jgi:hypothetical protein